MTLTPTQREQILEREVARYTAKGYVLKNLTTTDATLVPDHRKKNVALDGCLTLVTLGLFTSLAGLAAGTGQHNKVTIHVNTDGSVLTRGPKLPEEEDTP